MDAHPHADCQSSYDRVADEYVQRIFDELQHKPLDRQLLDRFAASVRDVGPACDIGCGPGHVARYLHERGVQVSGIDLSPAMVERAQRLTPEVPFRQGDMTALDVPDEAWAGIVAFYSIIHVRRDEIGQALSEFRRVLRPGGLLFLAFHLGEETIHLDEWWGHKVCVDFSFFRTEEMAGFLRAAGLEIEEIIERDPYPDVEHQSRRAYIFARKPKKLGTQEEETLVDELLASNPKFQTLVAKSKASGRKSFP
jgi:SAM-dependent methyltransferase